MENKDTILQENERLRQENEQLQRDLENVKAERSAAAADIARLIWLYGDCKYCVHSKGKARHKLLDGSCKVCEPKWRGMKRRI